MIAAGLVHPGDATSAPTFDKEPRSLGALDGALNGVIQWVRLRWLAPQVTTHRLNIRPRQACKGIQVDCRAASVSGHVVEEMNREQQLHTSDPLLTVMSRQVDGAPARQC